MRLCLSWSPSAGGLLLLPRTRTGTAKSHFCACPQRVGPGWPLPWAFKWPELEPAPAVLPPWGTWSSTLPGQGALGFVLRNPLSPPLESFLPISAQVQALAGWLLSGGDLPHPGREGEGRDASRGVGLGPDDPSLPGSHSRYSPCLFVCVLVRVPWVSPRVGDCVPFPRL